MIRYAVYGAGGFGKEVRGLLELTPSEFKFAGFIDDFKNIPPVPDDSFDDILLAIADCKDKRRIIESWENKRVHFVPFIAKDIVRHSSVQIAPGCIICPGTKLTVDINIGSFVIVNLNCTIGHDVEIGHYCSVMPSVNISGGVHIGNGCFIGSGATILQGICIGDNAVVGAGSVVTHDVPSNAIMAGVPARHLRKTL